MHQASRLVPSLLIGCVLTAQAPRLNEKNFAEWRDAILPTAEELSFEKIGWHSDLDSALEEGQRRDKPILLWVMNGHPLGCV